MNYNTYTIDNELDLQDDEFEEGDLPEEAPDLGQKKAVDFSSMSAKSLRAYRKNNFPGIGQKAMRTSSDPKEREFYTAVAERDLVDDVIPDGRSKELRKEREAVNATRYNVNFKEPEIQRIPITNQYDEDYFDD
jgi:hypothetical protein